MLLPLLEYAAKSPDSGETCLKRLLFRCFVLQQMRSLGAVLAGQDQGEALGGEWKLGVRSRGNISSYLHMQTAALAGEMVAD